MSRIVVLGCGAVGRHIAIDLCQDASFEVVSVDVNQEALEQWSQIVELTDDMRIKAEEVVHQLNENPEQVPVKRKVFGKKNR